jgi:hypothetical protein
VFQRLPFDIQSLTYINSSTSTTPPVSASASKSVQMCAPSSTLMAGARKFARPSTSSTTR